MMNGESTSTQTARKQLTVGLAAAVFVWGIYLAVGAVRYNEDIRKGVIIFGCTAAFLLLWWSVHTVSQQERLDDNPRRSLWSYTSSAGFFFASIAAGSMLTSLFSSHLASTGTYRGLLAVSMFTSAISFICSIVGLSSRKRPRGKWLGMLALVLLVTTLTMGFFVAPFQAANG